MSVHPDVLDPLRRADEPALRDWLELWLPLVFEPQRAVAALERTLGPAASGPACPERVRPPLDGPPPRRPDPAAAGRLLGLPSRPAGEIDALVSRLGELGVLAVPWGSPAYPAQLAGQSDAPPLLLVRGRVADLTAPCVAVVGSRAASAYGRSTADRFARSLACAGYRVVSGLATGIDGVAHEATLAVGGRTVAVMASGPEQVYPRRHRALAQRIAGSGALVTEFPPGTPPRPPHFPLRNRIISGISLAVLVVEARERSGSLVTAGLAAGQGVDVWAVPGPVDVTTSRGTNRLLRDGAFVATDPELLLEQLSHHAPVPEPLEPTPADEGRVPGPSARRLLALLAEGPLTRDALARRLGAAGSSLELDLLELELAGRVVQDRDGRLRAIVPWKR